MHICMKEEFSYSSFYGFWFTHIIFDKHLKIVKIRLFFFFKMAASLLVYLRSNHFLSWSPGGDEQVYVTFTRIVKSKFSDFLGNRSFF